MPIVSVNPKAADYYLGSAAGLGMQAIRKEVALDGSTGGGEVGTVALFTVTGSIIGRLLAICTETLVGATATIEVGITGATGGIIAQTTGTLIAAGEIWHDATPDSDFEALTVMSESVIAGGADIFATVGTADLTDGTLVFMLFWIPLTDDANVVAA